MLKSNFRLENAVTVTKDRFLADDLPEVRNNEEISWGSKTVEEDETHIEELKKKLAKHHAAVMRAFRNVPKLVNKLNAMEQIKANKALLGAATETKVVQNAKSREKARLERLANEEELLQFKKSLKVVAPVNRKRSSSDDLDDLDSEEEERKKAREVRHKKKKEARMKKHEEEAKEEEKKDEAIVRVFKYKARNAAELKRLEAWTDVTETPWHYSKRYGIEALERLIARGEPVPDVIALAREVCDQAQAVLAAEAPILSSSESSPISSESEPEIQDQMSSLRLAR